MMNDDKKKDKNFFKKKQKFKKINKDYHSKNKTIQKNYSIILFNFIL